MIPLIAGCTRRERDRHSRHVILCRKACDEQRSKLPRRISRKARHGALCISRAVADQNEHLSSPKGQPVPLRRVISSHPHARRKRGCPQFFDRIPAAQVRRRCAPLQQLRLPAGQIDVQQVHGGKAAVPAQQVGPVQDAQRIERRDACAQQGRASTSSASTISAASKAIGPFLPSTVPPARANGSRVPA